MPEYTPELRAELDAALKNIDAETETEGYGAESFSGSDLSTWERGVIIDTLFATLASRKHRPTIRAAN